MKCTCSECTVVPWPLCLLCSVARPHSTDNTSKPKRNLALVWNSVLARLDEFLPRLAAANAELSQLPDPSTVNMEIEDSDEQQGPYIQLVRFYTLACISPPRSVLLPYLACAQAQDASVRG